MVQWPLRANCRGLILAANCERGLLEKNPSVIFARSNVKNIGRKSLSIDCGEATLAMGDIIEDLSNFELYPFLMD